MIRICWFKRLCWNTSSWFDIASSTGICRRREYDPQVLFLIEYLFPPMSYIREYSLYNLVWFFVLPVSRFILIPFMIGEFILNFDCRTFLTRVVIYVLLTSTHSNILSVFYYTSLIGQCTYSLRVYSRHVLTCHWFNVVPDPSYKTVYFLVYGCSMNSIEFNVLINQYNSVCHTDPVLIWLIQFIQITTIGYA